LIACTVFINECAALEEKLVQLVKAEQLIATVYNGDSIKPVQPYELILVELDYWNIKISGKYINVFCMNIR
jgi:hypothetical protein